MEFKRKSIVGLLVAMGIVFAGIAYAQTAADVDYDGDGVVGVGDFLLFVARFGTMQGGPNYDAKYDLDSDGQVGVSDFLIFFGFFGQSTVPNDAPVLQRIGDQGVPKGGTLTLNLVASDPNGDPLTFSVSGNPAGSSLLGTTFSWTPTSGQSGTYQVTFIVKDGKGGTDTETITLRIVEAFQFNLIKHEIETELPSFVNILFEVRDSLGQGVNYLTTEYFEVRENGQPVSPTESAMNIRKRNVIPYSLKTVLMLDTSTSVGANLADIKNAAITLVQNMTTQQEIALYEFSEKPVLLQDFTNDVGVLTRAIQGIRLGFPTTNLYGSVIEGSARWKDIYTTTEVKQGFMIILTDGRDTQGSRTLQEVLRARGSKNIYTIGLGNEIDPNALQQLGNAGFFQLNDVSELTAQFIEIQTDIALLADSFYQLNYLSPKRGNRRHTLELSVKGNQLNSTIRGEFYSGNFYSVRQGVFVNASPSNTEGIKKLMIAWGDTVRLQAVTYLGGASPQYSWSSSNSSIVDIKPDPVDASMAQAIAKGSQIGTPPKGWTIAVRDSSQTVTLTVFDQANGLDRQVEVQVEGRLGILVPSRSFTLPGGASLDMVWIEAGTFQMGSPSSEPDRGSDEGPVHAVTISRGFYLGQYEVTQEQWESVMGTRPWQGQNYVRSGSNYPAVYVSWEDAQKFIRRLNTSVGRNVYRLPTEAEWEYACRAGTTTRWSFGDDESQLRDYAWYRDNAWDVGERYAHIVGTKRANPYGLYDMHGNVWEWVQDWYDGGYYRSSPSVDPQGPSAGSYRVVRDGSFGHVARFVRSAFRYPVPPSDRYIYVGFRLLRQGP